MSKTHKSKIEPKLLQPVTSDIAVPQTGFAPPVATILREESSPVAHDRQHSAPSAKPGNIADNSLSQNSTDVFTGSVLKPRLKAKEKEEEPRPLFVHFSDEREAKHRIRERTVDFALIAGVNLNGQYNNQTKNKMTNGFHAGGELNIRICDHLAFQPQLFFIGKGNEFNSVQKRFTGNVSTTTDVVLDYVQLPLNLVYKSGKFGTGRFLAGGGPFAAYLAYSQIGNNAMPDDSNPNPTALPSGNFKRFDFGFNCFIGCELPKGFFATGGAELGLINTQQNPDNGGYFNKNYNFTVTIGQFFGSRR